ncbi:hypothetical protein C1645_745956 [Glomus cerebriforme]|uniref:Transposase putative helix-turn-helix domain-containing protein n=1 Tax=Glomus cerebriforme TaxID=658196 RepID=A0A397S0A7_9GLOM|nr:hypothetical protein C1645_745956 [Glomus cerebriforme]
MKRKTRSTSARNIRKKESTTINRTIQIRVYPNKSQVQILKCWLGLSRYTYNAIIGINRKKKVYSKECKCGPSMVKFLKPMSFESKMKLFFNVKADKDSTPEEDLKLQKNSVWGERKFSWAAVRLEMLLCGIFGIAPANITDEAIDEALTAKEEIFSWVYEKQRQVCETQADCGLHAVSIDPGIRFLFTWYYLTKCARKIGLNNIGRIIRICFFIDKLCLKRDKILTCVSKCKKNKAHRIDKAISWLRRNIKRLQTEIHRKTIKFLTREFDVIIISPFEVSDMVNHKTRKIIRSSV